MMISLGGKSPVEFRTALEIGVVKDFVRTPLSSAPVCTARLAVKLQIRP